ncbi:MAG: aminoglycoside phosphotransferase family protein [Rickettsiales bacterium]|jgi:aminoglycoside phosphotransferase (APT) family kinase protein|nr:aminoglycoside phosphotransferase family protein [Rickettsiales bacterium]
MNKDDIIRYLSEKYPASDIRFFGEGWTSAAFAVDGNILRFPKTEEYMKNYHKEKGVLSLIRPFTDTPIPDVEIIADEKYPHAKHKLLPGAHWDLNEFEAMPPDMQDALARDAAAFLWQVHNTDLNAARLVLKMTKTIETPLEPVRKSDIWSLIRGYVPAGAFDNIWDKYMEIRDVDIGGDPVVIHADFKGTNTVIDSTARLAGVFDFVNAKIAAREYEFKYFYNPAAPTFLRKFSEEYGKLSGFVVDVGKLKILCMRHNIDGMRRLGDSSLDSIRDGALKQRAERMMFFA